MNPQEFSEFCQTKNIFSIDSIKKFLSKTFNVYLISGNIYILK